MKLTLSSLIGICLASIWAPGLGWAQATADADARGIPVIPHGARDLLYARPFRVEQPIPFVIAGRQREVDKGFLLVLKADLVLLEPKNMPDFVIFVDQAVAPKINSGYRSGNVLVMVPECDLTKARIWFGPRLLPDRLTPQGFEVQRQQALEKGIPPFPKDRVEAALARGGEVLEVRDMNELWYEARPLIIRYSPEEREMAESLDKNP